MIFNFSAFFVAIVKNLGTQVDIYSENRTILRGCHDYVYSLSKPHIWDGIADRFAVNDHEKIDLVIGSENSIKK